MKLIGWAFSLQWREWRLGWCRPTLDGVTPAGPVDGDWWFCMGPVALMFEDRRPSFGADD